MFAYYVKPTCNESCAKMISYVLENSDEKESERLIMRDNLLKEDRMIKLLGLFEQLLVV